jgi:hypothetical protein
MRLVGLVLLLVSFAPSNAQAPAWTAADFRGLKLGSAKLEDVERVLGKPDSQTSSRGPQVLGYKKKGDNGGDLEAEIRKGVLYRVSENLPVAMPRGVAFRQYGKDYVERRYSSAKCPSLPADDLLYRDRKGDVELLEYPQKGLLLWPDKFGYDIAGVVYRAEPLAAKKPGCGARSRKR